MSVAACVSEKETFIEDFKDLGLPRYTEAGNNITGAYQNEDLWISEFSHSPDGGFSNAETFTDALRLYDKKDSIWLCLSGVNNADSRHLLLMFFLEMNEDFNIMSFDKRLEKPLLLNDKNTLILSGEIGSYEFTDTIGYAVNGNLFIRHVIHEEENSVISGTFGFDAHIDNENVSFYKGRFDFYFEDSFILDLDEYLFRNEAGHAILNRRLRFEN